MKHSIIILIAFCFCTNVFSQKKSLFYDQKQDLWKNLTIKKSDSSLLLKELLNTKIRDGYTYNLPNLLEAVSKTQFLESENSATKNPMPTYKPKGNFKSKSIFPDNTMNYYLLREPVKER